MITLLIIALALWSIVGLIRVCVLIENDEMPDGNYKQVALFLIVHGPGVILVGLVSATCVGMSGTYSWLWNKLGDKTS